MNPEPLHTKPSLRNRLLRHVLVPLAVTWLLPRHWSLEEC